MTKDVKINFNNNKKKKKNYQNNHYNYFSYSMFFKVQIYFG